MTTQLATPLRAERDEFSTTERWYVKDVNGKTLCVCFDKETAALIVGLSEDARIDGQILDWLERKSVNVREPLAHGSRDLFWCSPEDLDGDEGPSNLRLTCHKHMRAENKAALAGGGQ